MGERLTHVCVFLKPLRPIPRSSVRWSPRSGHGSGLYWHPAVGCGDATYSPGWVLRTSHVKNLRLDADRSTYVMNSN